MHKQDFLKTCWKTLSLAVKRLILPRSKFSETHNFFANKQLLLLKMLIFFQSARQKLMAAVKHELLMNTCLFLFPCIYLHFPGNLGQT